MKTRKNETTKNDYLIYEESLNSSLRMFCPTAVLHSGRKEFFLFFRVFVIEVVPFSNCYQVALQFYFPL